MTTLLAAGVVGVVVVLVPVSRRMPWWARLGLILVGFVLIALPVVPLFDFTTGHATLQ